MKKGSYLYTCINRESYILYWEVNKNWEVNKMVQLLETKGALMFRRAEGDFWAYEGSQAEPTDKSKDLALLDNVQFIYELSLAELELKALGAEFEVTNGLREFKVDIKYEFNSDNARMYSGKSGAVLLTEGKIE